MSPSRTQSQANGSMMYYLLYLLIVQNLLNSVKLQTSWRRARSGPSQDTCLSMRVFCASLRVLAPGTGSDGELTSVSG
jgi:hypothetical protein